MLGLCYRHLQNSKRQCGVHELRGGDLLWNDGRNGRSNLRCMSCELELAELEYSRCSLYLQRWVYWTKRRRMLGLRCRHLQNRER